EIDVLFRGVDLLLHISNRSEAEMSLWETDHATEINDFLEALTQVMTATRITETSAADPNASAPARETAPSPSPPPLSTPVTGETARQSGANALLTLPGKQDVSDRV